MTDLILAAKAGLAVMLIVAGGAKLSDLASFTATVRLFVPRRRAYRSVVRATTLGIVLAELLLGVASLSFPAQTWINASIFGVTCGFVVVSAYGFAFHRGRSCTCFGALSGRRFDRAGIVRSTAIAAIGALTLLAVTPGAVDVGLALRLLLLAAALLLSLVSMTAARALALSRTTRPGL